MLGRIVQGASLGVTVAGRAFALKLAEIAAIAPVPACTRVPNAPTCLLGLAQMRGAVLPMVSLAGLLDVAPGAAAPARQARMVVLAGAQPVGVLVDGVGSLQSGPEETLDIRALLARAFGARLRPAGALQPAARQADAIPAVRNELPLVGLRVGRQEFALPLGEVAEIIRVPTALMIVPQSDDAMRGVIATRDGLLPLVSLAAKLGFAEAPASRARRIVAVGLGGVRFGLLVDGVTGLLNVPAALIDPVPPMLARASGTALLAGICRLEGGARLLGLLALPAFFDGETLAQLEAAGPARRAETSDAAETHATGAPFIVFRVGAQVFGLPLDALDEVVRRPGTLSPLPHAADFVSGLMSLRGALMPVIDMGQCLVGAACAARHVLVVSAGGRQAGLAVDSVDGMLRVDSDFLRNAPALAAEGLGDQLFDRVALPHEGGPMLLLSPRAMLALIARDLVAAS